MKYALIPLLALAVKGCPVNSTGQNLIVNSNFSQNKCPSAWCIFNQKNYHSSVKAWLPEPEIEIGNGNVYSTFLGKQRVLELNGNKNTCATQIIPAVAPGLYKISVSHAARKGVALSDNTFNIQFNGNVLKTVTPTDYLVHTTDVEVQINSELQDASLKLCGDGKSNGKGAIVQQVKMFRIYKDLINNGDLKINTCGQEWCVYDSNNYDNQVQGWLPDSELQIGYGYLYTDRLDKQRVMELDGNKNACAKQIIPLLTPGLYQFEITYGARSNVPLTTDNQFSIKFNEKEIKKVIPTSYDLQKSVIEISVQSDLRNVELKLCGQGQSNGLGAFIKSTKLIKTDHKFPISISLNSEQVNTQPVLDHFKPQIFDSLISTNDNKANLRSIHSDNNKAGQLLNSMKLNNQIR